MKGMVDIRGMFRREWPGLLVLLLTWVVFFGRYLFAGQVYFFDDLQQLFYPLESAYQFFQRRWELPAWDPAFGFGHPLLAWGQVGFLAPIPFLLRLLPLHSLDVVHLSLLLHFLVGLGGMYLLLRLRTLGMLSSALGAVVYVFNGFMVSHLQHANYPVVLMMVPWLLVVLGELWHRPQARAAAGVAIVAAALMQGHVQMVLLAVALVGLAAISLYGWPKRSVIVWLVVSGVVAFCLAALAILPVYEFLPLNDRSAGITDTELFNFSYPPWQIITLVWPSYFGTYGDWHGVQSAVELTSYVGFVPLLLAAVGLLGKSGWRRERRLGGILLVLGFVVALGAYSPIYRWLVLYDLLPPFTAPARFILLVLFAVSVLAAVGFEKVLTRWPRRWLGGAVVLVAATNLVWFGWGWYEMVPRGEALAKSAFVDQLRLWREENGYPPRLYSEREVWQEGEEEVFGEILPTEPLSGTMSVHQEFVAERDNLRCVVVGIASEQVVGNNLTVKLSNGATGERVRSLSVSEAALSAAGQERFCFDPIVDSAGRSYLLSFEPGISGASTVTFHYRPREGEGLYLVRVADPNREQWDRSRKLASLRMKSEYGREVMPAMQMLTRHLNVTERVSGVRWIGSISVLRFHDFVKTLFANDGATVDGDGRHVLEKNRAAFDMAGVTHVIQAVGAGKRDTMSEHGFELVGEEIVGPDTYRLYTNKQVLPRAFLVPRAEMITDITAAIAAVGEPDFDSRAVVYMEGDNAHGEANEGAVGTAVVASYESTRVEVNVVSPSPAWLVLTDTFTPQWQAYVDGQEQQLRAVNGAFRAVWVSAGEHQVEFVYESLAVRTAARLTWLGLLVVVLLIVAGPRIDALYDKGHELQKWA